MMRCLEKRPADRWQSAAELAAQLEAAATPSGRNHAHRHAADRLRHGSALAIQRRHPLRVAALFVAASVLVLGRGLFPGAATRAARLGALGGGRAARHRTPDHAPWRRSHERRRALERDQGLHVATPAGGLAPWLTLAARPDGRRARVRRPGDGRRGSTRPCGCSASGRWERWSRPACSRIGSCSSWPTSRTGRPIRHSEPRSPRPSGSICRSRPRCGCWIPRAVADALRRMERPAGVTAHSRARPGGRRAAGSEGGRRRANRSGGSGLRALRQPGGSGRRPGADRGPRVGGRREGVVAGHRCAFQEAAGTYRGVAGRRSGATPDWSR